MTLRYEVTIDDLAELAVHQNGQMFGRRWLAISRWLGLVVGCVFLALFGVSLVVFEGSGYPAIAPLFLLLALVNLTASIMLWTLRWFVTRSLRRMNKDGRIDGFLGEHELELADDALVLRNRFVESRIRDGSLFQVDARDGYTFVYTRLQLSIVIPHAGVTAGDPAAFVTALKQKLAATAPTAG